jgi:acetolactate synthase-like protein
VDINGGDVIARVLRDHGVRYLFTLCGGHISPILVGCKQAGIRVIDVRHEAHAVFAADATARLTGLAGVAAVTAGPGLTNALTALKNAQMAQSPVILLGGAAPTVLKGRGALQDIDHLALVRTLVHLALTIQRNCDIAPALELAFQVAQSGVPGPVYIECPMDLLYSESQVRKWYGADAQSHPPQGLKGKLFRHYLDRHLSRLFECELDEVRTAPLAIGWPELKPRKVSKAAALLRRAQTPLLIVGSQAMLSPDRIENLAAAITALQIPVYLTGMARGLLGRSHRLQMRHRRREALKQADLVLLAGMPCDFRLDYGRAVPPGAKLIAINRSTAHLRLNRKPELAIHGDAVEALDTLAQKMGSSQNRWPAWLDRLRQADEEREAGIWAMAAQPTDRINPLYFLKQLDAFLEDDALLVADGGDFVASAAYILQPRAALSWLDPGVFGTLGVGAGFAMGAKLVRPDKEVWLLYGDGAAGFSLQELDTCVRHGIAVIAVVGNDAGWSQIAREQIELLGDDVATGLRYTDYHEVARGYGAKGYQLDDPAQTMSILHKARKAARRGHPVLINVLLGKSDFRKGSISM